MGDRSVTCDELIAEQTKSRLDVKVPLFVSRDELERQARMPYARQRFVASTKGPLVFTERHYTCASCHQILDEMNPKRCVACRQVFYCDTTCQTKDWSRHKDLCTDNLVDKVKARALCKDVRRREALLLMNKVGEVIQRMSDEKAAITATAITTGMFYIRTMSSASSILLLHSLDLSFILHSSSSILLHCLSLSRIVGIGDKTDERVEKKEKKKTKKTKKQKKKPKKKEKCNDVPEYDDDSEDLPEIDWGIEEPPKFKPFWPLHDVYREDLDALATTATAAIEASNRARYELDYAMRRQRRAISAYQNAVKGPAKAPSDID
jgi:hypothetical protein